MKGWTIILVVLVVIVAGAFFFIGGPERPREVYNPPEKNIQNSDSSNSVESYSQNSDKFEIYGNKLLFTGGYADPSVIKNSDGSYFMYLNRFGGSDGGIFVLSSSDGVDWKEETPTILKGIATARAVRFSDGIRLYYPKEGKIYSSLSSNGLSSWKDDGLLLSPNSGYMLEGPGIIKLSDGSYRMYFDEFDSSTQGEGNILLSEIYGASSSNGLNWIRDSKSTIVFEDSVEGFGRPGSPKQVLHPFLIEIPGKGYYLFYNAHSKIFAAKSSDGFTWEKLGYIGLEGADLDGIILSDDTLRIYYGTFSPETSGVVHTATLKFV